MGNRNDSFKGKADGDKFQKNLTIGEAKHLIRNEGGVLTPMGIAVQVITILAVSGFSAWAIIAGKATAWHLFLPMVTEYLVLLIAMPPVNLILRDPGLRKESRRGVVLLGIFAASAAGWIAWQAHRESQPFGAAATTQWAALRDWIVGTGIHWAILAAAAGRIGNIPSRIAAFRRHGPPFLAVGIGCGMRLGLFVLAIFWLPWVAASSGKVVWAVWGLILLAEAAALLMHLDIQMHLKRRGIEI